MKSGSPLKARDREFDPNKETTEFTISYRLTETGVALIVWNAIPVSPSPSSARVPEIIELRTVRWQGAMACPFSPAISPELMTAPSTSPKTHGPSPVPWLKRSQ